MRFVSLLLGMTCAAGTVAAQCPPGSPTDAAPFDGADARALAGTYHLVMTAGAPGARRDSAAGRLLLWVPDTLTAYYELTYADPFDSASATERPGAKRLEETWRRTAHPQLLQGATTIRLAPLGAPAREDLTSRDPRSPGLRLYGDTLLFAPRLGWTPVDGEWTRLLIERVGPGGFEGRWTSSFDRTKHGARPGPSGRFCAVREH